MDIPNPRRILAVTSADSSQLLSKVIKDLTGTHPSPPASTTLAGTTHPLPLSTPYYTATIPIWLDLIAAPASDWASSFLAPEAAEVLAALGGVVVIFRPEQAEQAQDLVRQVGRVVQKGLSWEWDGVALAVGVSSGGRVGEEVVEEWEGVCAEAGLEFVLVAEGVEGRNEFGEKVGMPRVLEALQANDWAQVPGMGGAGDGDDEFGEFAKGEDDGKKDVMDEDGDDAELDPESLDFGFDKADFEGLRRAIWSAGQDDSEGDVMDKGAVGISATGSLPDTKGGGGGGMAGQEDDLGDEDVKKLEQMMRKLQAVRDMSAGLPEEQRKRMAARAVGEVMKEL